jgi:alkanesulfonate monooxygenase SsuD/methylene tetrahydromethanopterin reductase-like flavin-dependent oxidoreductase (luciferase family)
MEPMNARPAPRTGLALREPLPWHEMVLAVETAETAAYEALFVPEIVGREAFATLGGLSRATYRIKVGTGVLPVTSRKPDVLAMGAATVNELSYGRMILGLGSGTPGPGSLIRLRRMVAFLRPALAGEPVDLGGGDTFQLSLRPQSVPIWLAALGPKTMRLAGEIADGVLLNWCTPERVRQARSLVDEGARAAGRDPADVTVAVYVRACVGHDLEQSFPVLKSALMQYASIPHYRQQFEQMGFRSEAAAAAGGRVDDAVVSAVCLHGDPAEATARLQRYRDAGADLPIVYPVPAQEPVSSINGTILGLAPQASAQV